MMKKLLLAALLTLPLCASGALAQLTGPSLLNRVSIDLDKQHYRVDVRGDRILLVDGKTGATVAAVEQTNRQTVTITGAVADLSRLTAASRKNAMARIALFNFSSPVGTLTVDEKSGKVTMVHHLNAGMVPSATIAQVAELCGDVIRQESRTLAQ